MCDSFRNEVLWQFMTGAQWVAHPGNDGVHSKVRITSDDPLVAGIDDFEVETEQYCLHVDPAVKVHAVCDFPVAMVRMRPMVRWQCRLCIPSTGGRGGSTTTHLGIRQMSSTTAPRPN